VSAESLLTHINFIPCGFDCGINGGVGAGIFPLGIVIPVADNERTSVVVDVNVHFEISFSFLL
jgi:hypothetical protein